MAKIAVLPIAPEDFDSAAFFARVERGADDECWEWRHVNSQGYGRWRRGGHDYQAHRISCVIHGKPLTTDDVVDHLCRNHRCVNPAHLDVTTVLVNTARGIGPTAAISRARLAGMCINGHVLAEVGLHKQADSWTCAECGRERVRRYKARKAQSG